MGTSGCPVSEQLHQMFEMWGGYASSCLDGMVFSLIVPTTVRWGYIHFVHLVAREESVSMRIFSFRSIWTTFES